MIIFVTKVMSTRYLNFTKKKKKLSAIVKKIYGQNGSIFFTKFLLDLSLFSNLSVYVNQVLFQVFCTSFIFMLNKYYLPNKIMIKQALKQLRTNLQVNKWHHNSVQIKKKKVDKYRKVNLSTFCSYDCLPT